MSDTSFFLASGKRFSIDVKVCGFGFTRYSYQFESHQLTRAKDGEVERLLSSLGALVSILNQSTNGTIRRLALDFACDIDTRNSDAEAFWLLNCLAVDVNRAQEDTDENVKPEAMEWDLVPFQFES